MSREFHDNLIVIDALEYNNWDREVLEELHAGGITCVHVTCAVWENARGALKNICRWYRLLRENEDLIIPAYTGDDIKIAKNKGKTAIILGLQNSSPLESDLGLVEAFYRLGIRIIQLTYNNQNFIGCGCYEENDSGLSRFGREVVHEMNRLGIIIDLAHVGERTSLEAIEASYRPVAITHSNPYWFHAANRNKSDHVLKALAQNEGVLGFVLFPDFIGGHQVTLREFCDMIARTVDMIGIDHVGFGTDLTRKWPGDHRNWLRLGHWTYNVAYGVGSPTQPPEWPQWPEWFQSAADFPNLTRGLLDCGFSREEVTAIMGGNWLRLFSEGLKAA